jgi:hypothetical protein
MHETSTYCDWPDLRLSIAGVVLAQEPQAAAHRKSKRLYQWQQLRLRRLRRFLLVLQEGADINLKFS